MVRWLWWVGLWSDPDPQQSSGDLERALFLAGLGLAGLLLAVGVVYFWTLLTGFCSVDNPPQEESIS
jgi:hypothetical protein